MRPGIFKLVGATTKMEWCFSSLIRSLTGTLKDPVVVDTEKENFGEKMIELARRKDRQREIDLTPFYSNGLGSGRRG